MKTPWPGPWLGSKRESQRFIANVLVVFFSLEFGAKWVETQGGGIIKCLWLAGRFYGMMMFLALPWDILLFFYFSLFYCLQCCGVFFLLLTVMAISHLKKTFSDQVPFVIFTTTPWLSALGTKSQWVGRLKSTHEMGQPFKGEGTS